LTIKICLGREFKPGHKAAIYHFFFPALKSPLGRSTFLQPFDIMFGAYSVP
jgi:hypothetical protein